MSESEVVPVAPDMVVSETLGGYDLLRRLGSGGMAEVHLARANGIEGFQKLVVLKQILPHLSRDQHFVRMFLEEARLAALLDHPNVVQVFDLGKEANEYFFTMEFVYGESLQGLLKTLQKVGQTLSVENAVCIAMGVAAGLHYAHERVGFDGRPLGIVHRDVSPTNVMITYEGGVKVADFGIAKVITRTDVTRAGTRKGKVPYMSPEQCRAEKIDRRSDVFSLGIVLWEAVTGQRLFEGDNEFGVMNLIVHGHMRRPSQVRPDIPKDLERIIMTALTVDRDKRYQSTRQLQLDLENFACEHKLRATSSGLGELMHYLYRPQPFPWGALRGSSGKGQMSPVTMAEISSMIGSQPSIPGTGFSRIGSEVTSGVKSYASQIHAGMPTNASIGSMPSQLGAGGKRAPNKTLRGIAIGLGSAAGLAMVLVLGLYLGGRGAKQEAEAAATSEQAEAAEQAAASAAAAAGAVESPKASAEAGSVPSEPKVAAVAPVPEAAAEALPGEAAEGGEVPAEVPPTEAAEPGAGEPEAEAEPGEGEPEAEAEPEPEDELVIEDDTAPKKSGTKRTTKPRTDKPPKKKPDLDSFMPGFGG